MCGKLKEEVAYINEDAKDDLLDMKGILLKFCAENDITKAKVSIALLWKYMQKTLLNMPRYVFLLSFFVSQKSRDVSMYHCKKHPNLT